MTNRTCAKIIVTGGCGFIGCTFVRRLLAGSECTVINVDKLTYAASIDSLGEVGSHPNHLLERVDICDKGALERVFLQHKPTAVVHLAAESHVDRSIDTPAAFVETNIVGTSTLLDVSLAYWSTIEGHKKEQFRFHHVSTDEVYGDLDPYGPPFTEIARYAPSSPYSATKAASDHLVRAWHRTYGLPVVITNCSNNFGPYQFPEKLIPLMILNAIEGKPLPIYGDGSNVRDWLYVEDHARALQTVLSRGRIGETYNIGGGFEHTNLEVVQQICAELDSLVPDHKGSRERLIQFVTDRPGHDRRYAIDNTKITTECGWKPKETFESGMGKTVRWYMEHQDWVDQIRTGKYMEWIAKNYSGREVVA